MNTTHMTDIRGFAYVPLPLCYNGAMNRTQVMNVAVNDLTDAQLIEAWNILGIAAEMESNKNSARKMEIIEKRLVQIAEETFKRNLSDSEIG